MQLEMLFTCSIHHVYPLTARRRRDEERKETIFRIQGLSAHAATPLNIEIFNVYTGISQRVCYRDIYRNKNGKGSENRWRLILSVTKLHLHTSNFRCATTTIEK